MERKIDVVVQQKINVVEAIAKGDEVYINMFSELRQLERRFFEIEPSIPPEDRDVMWDYFGLCEDMTHRLLEIACKYMNFPGGD